jgi:hypothetical protein
MLPYCEFERRHEVAAALKRMGTTVTELRLRRMASRTGESTMLATELEIWRMFLLGILAK